MATTIRLLTEEIMEYLTKGRHTSDLDIDERLIHQDIKDATQSLIKPEILNGVGVTSHYIATFRNITVKAADATSVLEYATLPTDVISLPEDKGVWSVRKMGGDAFIPVPLDGLDVLDGILEKVQETEWTYEVDRGRVLFHKKNGKGLIESGITSVMIRQVIISLDDLGIDDPYPLPAEMIFELKNMVFEKYKIIFGEQTDLINDANATT